MCGVVKCGLRWRMWDAAAGPGAHSPTRSLTRPSVAMAAAMGAQAQAQAELEAALLTAHNLQHTERLIRQHVEQVDGADFTVPEFDEGEEV